MQSKIKSISGSEPVCKDDLKDHLKILHDTEDSLLLGYVTAAREYCEKYLNRALIAQTIEMRLDNFPAADMDYFDLRYSSPDTELTSITYTDSDGSVDFSDSVTLDNISMPNRIFLKADESWPTDVISERNVVIITYLTGYETCPEKFRNPILLMAADMYANRENPTRNFPTLAEKLLSLFRVHYYE